MAGSAPVELVDELLIAQSVDVSFLLLLGRYVH
jgi:hypothetical protein